MSNRNPYQARLSKRRRRKPGDMIKTQQILWLAILAAERALDDTDPEMILRAVHATSQACSVYAKLLEVGELESRLKVLEAQVGSICQRKS